MSRGGGGQASEEDTIAWIVVAILFGPLILGTLGASVFTPARTWMLEHSILVDEAVLLPFGGGIGLDLVRIVLVSAVILLFLVGAVAYVMHRRRADEIAQR